MAPLLTYQNEKDKVMALSDVELRKTVENGLPSIASWAAWEYASRLAVMPDKSSADFREGVDFLAKIASAREVEVKVSLYAFALSASRNTPLSQTVQEKILAEGGDELMVAVNDYMSSHMLRAIAPPAPAAASTPAQVQSISPGDSVTPVSSETSGNASILSEPKDYLTRWFPSARLKDIPVFNKSVFSPSVFDYFGELASLTNSGAKGTFNDAFNNYYLYLATKSLDPSSGNSASDRAAERSMALTLLGSFKDTFFKDFTDPQGNFLKNYWGNVPGKGTEAKTLLENGQLREFFSLLAQYPLNPLAAELKKNGMASLQSYNTTYLGNVNLFYDPGKGLVGRLDSDSKIVLNGFSGEFSIFNRYLHLRSLRFNPDLKDPIEMESKIDTPAQRFFETRLGCSFLIRIPKIVPISFFVEPSVSFAETPERIDLIDAKNGRYNIIKKPDLGYSIFISTTDPNTGFTYRYDQRKLMSIGNSDLFGDADFLLGQRGFFSDRGADPLYMYSYLKLRDQILLSGKHPEKTAVQDLGSYSILYIEAGLKSQYSKDQPASNVLLFVPAYQYNFNPNTSLTASARAGYSFDKEAGAQSGFDLRLINHSLSVLGGIEWLKGNFSGPATFKVSVAWSPSE